MSPEVILVVMLARAPWVDRNVPREERAQALAPIATAIADEARSPEEAGALIALGRAEGENFALAIVRGGCTASGCDHGRSRGVFQEGRLFCPAAYEFAAGTVESIRAETHCAAARLRSFGYQCRAHAPTPLHGAFAMLGTGHSCHWSGAEARVRAARHVVVELARAERED
jgi:hypothetical protein